MIVMLLSGLWIADKAPAQTVTLKQVGKESMLFNKRTVEYGNGFLYSLENTDALYKTDLRTGDQSRLGNVVYKNSLLFFIYNGSFYSLENDGSMYKTDLVTGARNTYASMGTWMNITRAFVVGNSLFSIEDGALYKHSALNTRDRKQLGGSDFYTLGALIRGVSSFYHLIGDGTLYEINTGNGDWKKIAKNKGWKNIMGGAVLNNKFYAVEYPGILTETALTDGTRKELDNTQFGKSISLVADGGKLYLITKDGNLFEITIN